MFQRRPLTHGIAVRKTGRYAKKPEAAPLLGEQNRKILCELGYTETQIKEITDSGVIGDSGKKIN